MKVALFIDYDNLLESHRISGVLDVVTRALNQVQIPVGVERGTCEVRVYGGWYEATIMTGRAQDTSVALQNAFPAIIRVHTEQGATCAFSVSAELAFSLLEDPSYHLFNTYRKKGKPSNLRVQKPAAVGCSNPMCPLPMARKLLRSGRCPEQTCSITSDDIVYRHEQKTVDTMLACDIVYSAQLGYRLLLLISGDDDFLPPIRTALIRGATVVRLHPKPNGPRMHHVAGRSHLFEGDL